MIIVSGGFGFIGSNLIKLLNAAGYDKILVIDDLTEGKKALNLANAQIYDFIDSQKFEKIMDESKTLEKTDVNHFFHLGAISATNEWNGSLVMNRNFEYSKKVLKFCNKNLINLTYASSASVYGRTTSTSYEDVSQLAPQTVYAYSKALFDRYAFNNNHIYDINVTGLRYFNVYGPGESHKIGMTSPVYMFYNQLMENEQCSVFGASLGYEKGDHTRDFIHVNDACKITKFFMNTNISGIFNVGTGNSTSFGQVADYVVKYTCETSENRIKYIDFPSSLKRHYQPFTCASIEKLRNIGYVNDFIDINDGIRRYINELVNEKNIYQ